MVTNSSSNRGSALVAVVLLIMLASALLAGFTAQIVTDEKLRGVDRTRSQTFYAAHGALEQLTADLGNHFMRNFAPTRATIDGVEATPPAFNGIRFEAPDGGDGYDVTYRQAPNGDPLATYGTIESGPFAGLIANRTSYTLTVTARGREAADGSAEVRLERSMNTVAIPVFQFGVFSETDLSFFPGPAFNFGGRVHTNGNLFLASGNPGPITLAGAVTAVRDVIRTNLANGNATAGSHPGNVLVTRGGGATRNLAVGEGSLVGDLGSDPNEPAWTNLSIDTYNGQIRNGRTGARTLSLQFVSMGASPIDLIKRGVPGESVDILEQRLYARASLRILLSDTQADLDALPGITPGNGVTLGTGVIAGAPLAVSVGVGDPGGVRTNVGAAVAAGSATITVNTTNGFTMPGELFINGVGPARCTGKTATTFTGCTNTPAFGTNRAVTSNFRSPNDTPLHGGVIKIEMQRGGNLGNWEDVTAEILNLGVTGRNLAVAACANAGVDPSPNAVIRLQRVRNNPAGGVAAPAPAGQSCGRGSPNPTDYWPNVLYDTREGNLRDDQPRTLPGPAPNLTMFLGGVMHYVELDVANLSRWFRGEIGVSGVNARNVNGYTVYFSDRRNNRNDLNTETGEYGFEDFVNPGSATGTPNGIQEGGENVNGDAVFDTYGQTPRFVGSAPLNGAARPWTVVPPGVAQVNRATLFRRALKLTNGSLGNLHRAGLTITSENPVYVHGNYNASALGFGNRPASPHAAAAIIADAVTLLSNAWNDNVSFAFPQDPDNRVAGETWYRMAIIGGKGPSFRRAGIAGAPPDDFGTDGGVHNFLRYIESWAGRRLNYRGSIASFYFNRQAVGTYKCCTNVYEPPTRGYNFDVEFLQPAFLPPETPMFRDINTTGFTQVIR